MVFCPETLREKYNCRSSLVHSAAAVSLIFTVTGGFFEFAGSYFPSKYIVFLNEVFSAAFVTSTIYLSLVFFMWAYNLSKTLKTLGVPVRNGPVMTVIWFFIPIMNIFKPYTTMRDFWEKTATTNDNADKFKILKIWWGAFLVSGILSKVALQAQLNVASLSALEFSKVMFIISALSNIVYIVVLIIFVRRFSGRLAEFCAARGGEA